MGKPESYRKRSGCHNCKHNFILYEYDAGPEYYCHEDKSYRPLSGSCAMKETWCDLVRDWNFDDILFVDFYSYAEEKLYHNAWALFNDAWNLWAEEHSVFPWNICDKWEEKI